MRNAVLLAGAALLATPAMAQQQPISPMAGGRIGATQPLATTTGATASSRAKPGSALETRPSGIIAATGGGLLADQVASKGDDREGTTDKKNPAKPKAALGASLLPGDTGSATASAATTRIPDVDASPGDSRPTRVIVRRPPPAAGPKRKQ